MNDRTRPRGTGSETAGRRSLPSVARNSINSDLALTHTAHTVGYEVGLAHGQARASEELARQWLHRDARMWTDMAITTAERRHGPAWAQAIREQAEGVGG